MSQNSLTRFPGGTLNGAEIEKIAAYTVVITTDSGKSFTTDQSITYTLPGIAIGNNFKFIYTGPDGAATIAISPNAVDGICYAGSLTDNKDLILAAATAKRGDYVVISAQDAVVAWQVTDVRGVWTKEA